MSAKTGILIVALAAALSQPGAGKQPTVPLPAPAAKVAETFLQAFTQNDREAISGLLPEKRENLYGPSPFAGMPKLLKPRADTRTGAIDFEGRMTDSGLPSKGTIVMRLVEEDGTRAWRARQLYWYEELPPEARQVPDSSPTSEDREQEPAIRAAATQFISAWLKGDYEAMDGLTFHWWEVPREPPKWVRMKDVDLRARSTQLDGLRIDFTADLRVARIFPKDVNGNLWLVKEDGAWRVRPLMFSFEF